MDENQRLSHSKWECKDHIVFIQNAFVICCTEIFGSLWASCFAGWPSRRNAASKKVTFWPIMFR